MGRPRTATRQLEAKGAFLRHPERKRARENEPKPSGPLGDPPKHLDRHEKAAWQYIASLLPEGLVSTMDRISMEAMAYLLVKCRRKLAKAADMNLLRGFLRDFGMTPADRSRVCVGEPEKTKNDPWERFLEIRNQ